MNDLVNFFRAGKKFLFILHLLPDGDSIGSTFALSLALEKMGKEITICSQDLVPSCYRFLAMTERVVPWDRVEGKYDAAVLLDCGDPSMAGGLAKILGHAAKIINIDHHATNQGYGDLVFLEPTAAAAGEVAYALIKALGVPLDVQMATSLYVSLVTDTGSFRYSSTTGATHRMAAEFLDLGVRAEVVNEEISESKAKATLDLLGVALRSLTTSEGGALAWLTITQKDFATTGASLADSEGIVNYPRSLKGTRIAVLFREMEDGGVKVSFRTRGTADAGELAVGFGGGGHAKAAGCTIPGPLDRAAAEVLGAARQMIARSEEG